MRIKGRQLRCEYLYHYWAGMHIDGAGNYRNSIEVIVIVIVIIRPGSLAYRHDT